jgi:hypothetical protein
MTGAEGHCEERSDEAIQIFEIIDTEKSNKIVRVKSGDFRLPSPCFQLDEKWIPGYPCPGICELIFF